MNETPALEFCGVGFSFPGSRQPLFESISFSVAAGQMVGLAGPNGSGKSTILRLASGFLAPQSGTVRLFGSEVHRSRRKDVARKLAVMGQDTEMPVPFTVQEMVRMGSYARGQALSPDQERRLLARLGLSSLGSKEVTDLSGGERQRVFLAQALAQQPEVLLLDEPTSHLDLRHQVELLSLLTELNRETGVTIVAVMHDLNLAAAYMRRLILLAGGSIRADGAPAEVLTGKLLSEVFGLEAVIAHTAGGEPGIMVLPPANR